MFRTSRLREESTHVCRRNRPRPTECRQPHHNLKLLATTRRTRSEHVVRHVGDDVRAIIAPGPGTLHGADAGELRRGSRQGRQDRVGVGFHAVGAAGPGPSVKSIDVSKNGKFGGKGGHVRRRPSQHIIRQTGDRKALTARIRIILAPEVVVHSIGAGFDGGVLGAVGGLFLREGGSRGGEADEGEGEGVREMHVGCRSRDDTVDLCIDCGLEGLS